MPEGACRKPPCRTPSTAAPLPRAIGVRSYFSYISLWQPAQIASGFEGGPGGRDCCFVSAAVIGELGKTQTAMTNIKMNVRVARRVCVDSSPCDAPSIGVICDKVVPIFLMNRFKFGFACSLNFLRGLGLSTSVLRSA